MTNLTVQSKHITTRIKLTAMAAASPSPQNPSKWRYTWQASSHLPTITLFVFNPNAFPSKHCLNLTVNLSLSTSTLLITFNDAVSQQTVSLRAPIPRVLIDPESSVNFRALDDHIEVKLVLLLPVDHPLAACLDENGENEGDEAKPLVMDSDLKRLSAAGEVHLYCRSCSAKLTKTPLRHFLEMPSVDWREVADNWFGSCCCSFGGVSEKLVARFANSYATEKSSCLLSPTTITLGKDDLVGCKAPARATRQKHKASPDCNNDDGINEATPNGSCRDMINEHLIETTCEELSRTHLNNGNFTEKCRFEVTAETELQDTLGASGNSQNFPSASSCCVNTASNHNNCTMNPEDNALETSPDKISLLNGFLGNIFMVRPSKLSTDVEWNEYDCPQCSNLLGAYPCDGDGFAPIDDRVQLFKCNVSTCLPVGGPSDFFRNYDLGRMFSNQILEIAKYELTFRSVVRDMSTKSPVLQIILLNMDYWVSTGYFLDTDSSAKQASKSMLYPVIKFLYSYCDSSKESEKRMTETWIKKNQAEEVSMFRRQIEGLVESLASVNDVLPPSCTYLEGSVLSFMPR